jgi:hypothetical protein
MTAWLGVVSADHVQRGVGLGIAQIGHGKKARLARMRAGDVLVYYSPRDTMGGSPLQEFTAIGRVADDELWQADEGDFRPWRRRVDYETSARQVALESVRAGLELTAGAHWGHQLRRGLVPLSDHDAQFLSSSMGAGW